MTFVCEPIAPPRPTLTPKQKLTIMARFCRCPGLPERGLTCGAHLPAMSDCEFDHIHARALGGGDDIDNYRPLCPRCHGVKTNGNGATTAGADKNRIAKTRRNAKAAAEFRARLLAKGADEPRSEQARRKSRIRSRGFQKRRSS